MCGNVAVAAKKFGVQRTRRLLCAGHLALVSPVDMAIEERIAEMEVDIPTYLYRESSKSA